MILSSYLLSCRSRIFAKSLKLAETARFSRRFRGIFGVFSRRSRALRTPMKAHMHVHASVSLRHDIHVGLRIHGSATTHARIHGRTLGVSLTLALDSQVVPGHPVDLSACASRLSEWLDFSLDRRLLVWERDPALQTLRDLDETIVALPFPPTSGNLARHLVHDVGPNMLRGLGAVLMSVTIFETAELSATHSLLHLA